MNENVCRSEIKKLIEKFERVIKEGRYKKYNEENTKKDFVLPLFRALGWNVEDSDEVKAEEKVSKKRVDYAFRINGINKFFLEVKALKEYTSEPEYIQQAIEYAWNKGVPWAVLTNFETLRVFNAEFKFDNKQPLQNVVLNLRYTDYLEEDGFKQLLLLSKDSFQKGILDRQAELMGKKVRKLPIDKQLLLDFTEYRKLLTRDILKNNPDKKMTPEDLDEVVQRILDRLIFIRMCEDREIESEKLISLVRLYGDKKGRLYAELKKKFREYDEGYNSRLFQPHLSDEVAISDDVLKRVILGTYRTRDQIMRYDFSAIDADVLGNIYEQYLGHVLKSTPKRMRIVNGRMHRKEYGIYYTPTYIVDYIVRNTVGEKLKQRGVKIDKLKILDPACGSGSFLIKAFDVLSEYVNKKEGKLQQTKFEDISKGTLLKRKTELLKNCIFGVDLDPRAVEIAQLNLLLKLAEKRHRLPTLQKNIKCGNSLIDDPEVAGERAFKWEEEFRDVMREGGFDIVIGNPPYIRNTELPEKEKIHYRKNYSTAYKQYDIYVLFFELGWKVLKEGGYLGFITSNKFIASDYGERLRKFILDNFRIISITDVSHLKIFKDASTYPVITILQKTSKSRKRNNNEVVFRKVDNVENFYTKEATRKVKQVIFLKTKGYRFLEHAGTERFLLANKIERSSAKVKDFFICKRGSPKNKIKISKQKMTGAKCCVFPRDIERYTYKISDDVFVISDLQDDILMKEKILLPRTVVSIKAAYDNGGVFIMDRIYYLLPKKEYENLDLKFITALLNSKLIDFFYKTKFSTTHVGGGYLDLRGVQILELPIKLPKRSQQQVVAKLVDNVISLRRKYDEIKGKKLDRREKIEEEINRIERKINDFVYKIYGLTRKEIEIIEGSLN